MARNTLRALPCLAVVLLFAISSAAHRGLQQAILSSQTHPKQRLPNIRDGDNTLVVNMTFDSIDMSKTANRTLASLEHMILFDHYEVVNTTAAVLGGYLDAEDVDCATSKPNAIRSASKKYWTPSVFRSNATALAALNVTEFFDLVSFAAKPLGDSEAWTYIVIDAYELDGKVIKDWHELAIGWGEQTGHLEPIQLEPREYFEGWGEHVNWVEFDARNDDGEPVPFCLDDIVLEFVNDHGDDD